MTEKELGTSEVNRHNMPEEKDTSFVLSNTNPDKRTLARRNAFVEIERDKLWGDSHTSGWGSTIDVTKITREIILNVIKQYNINSMVDVACGDFVWMPLVLQELKSDFKYVGCDIVPALIKHHSTSYAQYEFLVRDFVVDKLPHCDLIFCRDVLQHLTVADIKDALQNFSLSGSKYLLATTHLRRYGWKNGRDCRVGKCRDRNILLAPFNLPDPIAIFSEQNEGKYLGLWKLPFESK
jgi:hypothetical protein